jgi:hypothetical protein
MRVQNGQQWLLLISLMQLLYLTLTWHLSRSKVHNLNWLKGLGDGLGHELGGQFSRAMVLYKNPEEEIGAL